MSSPLIKAVLSLSSDTCHVIFFALDQIILSHDPSIQKKQCCLPTHLPEHQDGSLPDQNSGLKPDQAHFHTPDLGFRSPFTFTIAIYKTNYSQIHSLTSVHLLPYMKTYIDYPFLYLSHYQFCSQVHPGQGSPLLRSAPTAFSSPLVCWQVTRTMSRPDNAIYYSFHKL